MDLERLKYNKIIRDIKYWNEEYNHNSILNSEIETLFKKEVDEYLLKYDLCEEFYQTNDIKHLSVKESKDEIKDEKSDYVKKLYREIVKNTHPDKIDDRRDLFEKAYLSYKDDNYLNILLVADILNIEIDLSKLDNNKILNDIEQLKNKSKMFENSTHWKWYYDKDISHIEKYVDSIIYNFNVYKE